MNILLTGASGFLGSHLVRALAADGHALVALKRKNSDLARLGDLAPALAWYEVEGGLERPFREHPGLDVVIHMATCYGRQGEKASVVFETNTLLPLRLLELASASGVGLFINTDSCFTTGALRYNYLQSYTLSKKHFAEWGRLLASAGKVRFVNLKLQHPYGPGDGRAKFVPSMIRECLTSVGDVRLTPGEQKKDFVYVDDVVEAYRAVLSHPAAGGGWQEYDCGSGAAVSIRTVVETIHRLTRSRARLCFGALPYRENEIMYSCADITALAGLGWSSRWSLEEGLKQTVGHEVGAPGRGAGRAEGHATAVR